jgi:hypothetical protein
MAHLPLTPAADCGMRRAGSGHCSIQKEDELYDPSVFRNKLTGSNQLNGGLHSYDVGPWLVDLSSWLIE